MKDQTSAGLKITQSKLWFLDQTQLPHQEVWLPCESTETMAEAIVSLRVRGAPLIGVAAAAELGRLAESGISRDLWEESARFLRRARPTAVNLMAAVDRLLACGASAGTEGWRHAVIAEAERVFAEDIELCATIGRIGAEVIADGDGVLTHCNAGALATAGIGTAIGVIAAAWQQGKRIHVYVDETRPLLQGARLTAWELKKLGIPHTLICDNMAASLMSRGNVHKVIVGADRISANGDFANKIGTYSVAISAKFHGIPFYCAAPYTTIDSTCASGKDIPIEERGAAEVRRDWAPTEVPVWNPAFDVTPHTLVSGIITERGIRRF